MRDYKHTTNNRNHMSEIDSLTLALKRIREQNPGNPLIHITTSKLVENLGEWQGKYGTTVVDTEHLYFELRRVALSAGVQKQTEKPAIEILEFLAKGLFGGELSIQKSDYLDKMSPEAKAIREGISHLDDTIGIDGAYSR